MRAGCQVPGRSRGAQCGLRDRRRREGRMTDFNGRSALLDKIIPPLPAPHVIERPRILASLGAASQRRVTALTAGAGFGKTTALTAWAAGRNCAWYTVTTV